MTKDDDDEEVSLHRLDRRLLRLEIIVERQTALVSKLIWITIPAVLALLLSVVPQVIAILAKSAAAGV